MSSEILDARPGVTAGRAALSVSRGRSLGFRVALVLFLLVAASLGGAGGVIVYRSVTVVIRPRIEAVGGRAGGVGSRRSCELRGRLGRECRTRPRCRHGGPSVCPGGIGRAGRRCGGVGRAFPRSIWWTRVRQATFQSPLRSVDVVAVDDTGPSYSTGGEAPAWADLAPAVRSLAGAPPLSVVALPSIAGRRRPAGCGRRAAFGPLGGRPRLVRGSTRRGPPRSTAPRAIARPRFAAEAHVAASARFLAHAVELGAEAEWSRGRLAGAFSDVVGRTAASQASGLRRDPATRLSAPAAPGFRARKDERPSPLLWNGCGLKGRGSCSSIRGLIRTAGCGMSPRWLQGAEAATE